MARWRERMTHCGRLRPGMFVLDMGSSDRVNDIKSSAWAVAELAAQSIVS